MLSFIVFLVLLLSPVFVEGVTELVCKSQIFSGFREWVSLRSPPLKALIGCGYCASVWVAVLPAAWAAYIVSPSWCFRIPLFVFLTIVFHRLSNYLHNFNDKHLDKYYDNRLKG